MQWKTPVYSIIIKTGRMEGKRLEGWKHKNWKDGREKGRLEDRKDG